MANQARILGMGSYLPERVLTNQDLEKMVETSDEWIVSRTGMKERRIARQDECPSHMGIIAGKKALEAADLKAHELDLIIVATMTPDYVCPSTAVLIQAGLGAAKAGAFDVQASCSGYIYALSIAKAFIESKIYRHILVIAVEKMSAIIDYTDRSTCVLFGDGASAAVVSDQGQGFAIESICLGADGNFAESGWVPAGGSRHPTTRETLDQKLNYFRMGGQEIFKQAVRRMEATCKEVLRKCALEINQIDWLIPHQANSRIIEAIAKRFEGSDVKIYNGVHKYGNTSAPSVAIALNELLEEHPFEVGAKFLLVAFGVGLTWGATVLTKVDQ